MWHVDVCCAVEVLVIECDAFAWHLHRYLLCCTECSAVLGACMRLNSKHRVGGLHAVKVCACHIVCCKGRVWPGCAGSVADGVALACCACSGMSLLRVASGKGSPGRLSCLCRLVSELPVALCWCACCARALGVVGTCCPTSGSVSEISTVSVCSACIAGSGGVSAPVPIAGVSCACCCSSRLLCCHAKGVVLLLL